MADTMDAVVRPDIAREYAELFGSKSIGKSNHARPEYRCLFGETIDGRIRRKREDSEAIGQMLHDAERVLSDGSG